jgi:hypothetical protein
MLALLAAAALCPAPAPAKDAVDAAALQRMALSTRENPAS